MKANPKTLVRAHLRTLVDARTGERRWQDFVLFYGTAAGAFALSLGLGIEMSSTAAAGLLTVTGLIGAFLFGVMLQIADRALSWAESSPQQGPATSSHATFLKEISANAGYAALAASLASVVFVAASVTTGLANRISASVGIAVGIHALLTLLMVMVRVYALTESRLIAAQTGAAGSNVTPLKRTAKSR
ncbi:hypothetical protein [Patulibacter defluvii]|uniref:hypothetical protein n=1 Tax=Patulibacter defluvii TaxID=3095358 RepID=UPI002A749925|nr:hypothetical protein [Patulibacter sp. DM4]